MGHSSEPENGSLSPDGKFRFSCHRDLECYTLCCRNANIFLTPYDVLRMKNRLGVSSEEFLRKYTGLLFGEVGLPVVFLQMMEDEERTCPFVSDEGCRIYEDRPESCRNYPLKRSAPKRDGKRWEYYTIVQDPKCLGYQTDREWSLEGWKEDQGLGIYHQMEDLFTDITLNETLLKEDLRNDDALSMFLMAYDLDRFRRFIFETRFLEVFDIEEGVVDQIREDEEELLKFALRWLRFSFIDKGALKIKDAFMGKAE